MSGEPWRWHVLSECPDEDSCPIHGLNEDTPHSGGGSGGEMASYWRTAVDNLRRLGEDLRQDSLFDAAGE